jgi:hypothetical protein
MRSSGLDQIQFFDFENGWISGANLQSAPRDPFLLITTDGGKSWRPRPIFEESRVASIERFWFESRKLGTLLIDARLDNGATSCTKRGPAAKAGDAAIGADAVRFPQAFDPAAGACEPTPSSWSFSATCSSPSPTRWARCCARPRSAPTSKERRDYSCAVYDAAGETIAMGDHMPVHLGAMPLSVRHALAAFISARAMSPSSTTRFAAERTARHHRRLGRVRGKRQDRRFLRGQSRASRGRRRHEPRIHALAREIYQEGLRIPPVLLMRGGRSSAT